MNALPNPTHRLSLTLAVFALLSAARLAPGADAVPATAPAPEARPAKARGFEAFTLVGTGRSGARSFAFFQGNRAEFHGLARPGEKVGDCVLESVSSDSVRLRAGDQVFEMAMKMELRRDADGPWKLTALDRSVLPPERPAPAPSPATAILRAAGNEDAPDQPGFDKKEFKIEKALIEAMKPGKEFKPSKPDSGGDKFKKFDKSMRREK